MADDAGSLIAFHDLAPRQESFLDALLAGLASPRKAIPPQFLYDEAGAALFGQITQTPEYYPTRTELGILHEHGPEIAALIGPAARLIEFGASSGAKARLLLDAMDAPSAYVPVDVSAEHLRDTAEQMARDYPALSVVAVCADYTYPFPLPEELMGPGGKRVGFFPGSSIGNLTPEEAVQFLSLWRRELGPDSGMVAGVDLRKDEARLEAAYNDAAGVTAAFTHNLLARANRELGADFDLSGFAHHAVYNEDAGRIEIHLKSLSDQTVSVGGQSFAIANGEMIHTEYSYKYSVDGFIDLAARAGYGSQGVWTDPGHLFSVHYLS
ncbi:MAG: L-histidine N(alpha)-methyltransferase [Caulobacteraceae bacterium]